MDRNTTIGILLIAGILILFSVLNKPGESLPERDQRAREPMEQAREQETRDTLQEEPAEIQPDIRETVGTR
ncbi:MAG: hypothetical protein ACLFUC_07525, partial [Bacteroidales bacterium]